MTRSELLTAIKAYRDQGYTLEVKLNTTNDALQAEYNRLHAAWKSHNVDTVENCEPVAVAPVVEVVQELAPIDELAELAEVFEVGFTAEPVAPVVDLPTQRNIAAEVVAETKATDTYWLTWNAAYYRAVDALATTKHQSELTTYQAKWNTMMNSKTQKAALINHGQVGLVVVLMMIEFLKLTAILIGFTLAFTYPLMRRVAINHALIYSSFKSAVSVARRTLQHA